MPLNGLIFIKAGKDVAFSESAGKFFTTPAYNLPYFISGVGGKGRVLFFDSVFQHVHTE
jgi:hypothetical protein